jgi:hypothetical protein
MRKSELKQLIKEEIENVLREEESNTKFTNLLNQLYQMAEMGEIGLEDIKNVGYELTQARRRGQQNQRKSSPDYVDKQQAALQKSKDTKSQNKAYIDLSMQKSKEQADKSREEREYRKKNNLLPLTADNYAGNPDRTYYTYDYTDPKNGIRYFKLKNKYINTPIS